LDDKLPQKLMNTAAIRYFLEVARSGSFRKAAERVNVAASAINRQVRLLEEDLGTTLFERGRGRGGVKLTAAGEVMMRRVRYALNELATARLEIEGLRGLQRGRVSAGVTDALAREFIPGFLAAFHAANPRVDFEVKVANTPRLLDFLLEDQVDVVLAYDTPSQIGISAVAEYALESCVVVHKDHPLAGRASVRIAECAGYPLAMPDDSLYLRGMLNRMFHDLGVMPSPVLTTNSFELMRDMVDRAFAISLQTRLGTAPDERHPNLVYVPLADPLARYSRLAVCVRTSRRLAAVSALFVDRLVEALDTSVGAFKVTGDDVAADARRENARLSRTRAKEI
jgi:DNA-binding transcriptional LysR family regulator